MNTQVIQDTDVIVRATGEIDLSNVAEFNDALGKAADIAPKGYIIDLSEVTYMDSAGVQAVLAAYIKMHDATGRLALVVGNARVHAVLEVVRLEQLPRMRVCHDLDSAQQAIG